MSGKIIIMQRFRSGYHNLNRLMMVSSEFTQNAGQHRSDEDASKLIDYELITVHKYMNYKLYSIVHAVSCASIEHRCMFTRLFLISAFCIIDCVPGSGYSARYNI